MSDSVKRNANLNWIIRLTMVVIAVTWLGSLVSYAAYFALAVFLNRMIAVESPVVAAMTAMVIVLTLLLLISVSIIWLAWRKPLAERPVIAISMPAGLIFIVGACLALSCTLFFWKILMFFPSNSNFGESTINIGAFAGITVSIFNAAVMIVYRSPPR